MRGAGVDFTSNKPPPASCPYSAGFIRQFRVLEDLMNQGRASRSGSDAGVTATSGGGGGGGSGLLGGLFSIVDRGITRLVSSDSDPNTSPSRLDKKLPLIQHILEEHLQPPQLLLQPR